MVIIWGCLSFLCGMLWYILCDVYQPSDDELYGNEDREQDYFIDFYDIKEKSNREKSIIMTYFLFTSLSTVGLGDYTPRSDIERLVGAFVLLFGVAITSFLMESLGKMVAKFREFNNDIDHHE
tara:strand:+ start:1098 stop:1466 length:369 start_codon:yes stop_codon:yes gene_type:complete